MSINLTLQLASGQSLQGAPLELLSNGVAIARAQVGADGKVTFDTSPPSGQLAVRVDRSILQSA